MTAATWRSKIRDSAEKAGTYRDYFEPVIATLSDILEKRDKAKDEFEKSGSKFLILYTNKGKATNPMKNPLLIIWDELNTTALAYWKELGLTPSSFRKMNGSSAPAEEKPSGLAAALRSLETD